MKSLLDKSFRYVPVRDQGPDYLKRKFDRLRAEQRKSEAETKAKVSQLNRRRA